MTLHTDLPIYKKGCELVTLAFQVQLQMPRGHKRHLGEKITGHCTDMLDLMALANACRGLERAVVAGHAASGYTSPVIAKKAVIGCGSPNDRCSESRSICPADPAASLSVPPVLAARTGGPQGPAGLRKRSPAFHTRSSCRLHVEVSAAVVANRTAWRPFMAHTSARPFTAVSALPSAIAAPVKNIRWYGRYPKNVTSLRTFKIQREWAEVRAARDKAATVTTPAEELRHAISYFETCDYLRKSALASLRVAQQRAGVAMTGSGEVVRQMPRRAVGGQQ